MYRHIATIIYLGSNIDQYYIQNCVVMNHVIKRSRCNNIHVLGLNTTLFEKIHAHVTKGKQKG